MKDIAESLLLYAVTDRHWEGEKTLLEQTEQAIQGGATFVQIREKNLDDAHFEKEALAMKALCAKYKIPFVVNDNVLLAKKNKCRRRTCRSKRHGRLQREGASRTG